MTCYVGAFITFHCASGGIIVIIPRERERERYEWSLNWFFFLLSELGHPWICENGVAPDRALDPAVLYRLKQFSAMNKLKKMALRVWNKLESYIPFCLITNCRCMTGNS